MADLLGNRLCMENLQSDIQDVQWIINDVSSRTGPIKLSSWKFPDKLSWELDTEELLQTYGYAPDETEENQVAHIALYELLIDRLVSFIQGTAIYLNQIQHLDKASDNASAPPTSVGLAVRHFWDQLVNAQTVILQLYSQNKSNATKISELEKTIKNLSSQHAHLSSKSSFATHFLDQESQYYKSSDVKTISHDEISKSCQTVETAFVPCESCDLVQKKMRESGDLIIQVCQKQGLPSCLRKYRSQLADVKWLSSNDVSRWMAEENKDVQRLCKHIECVSNVIEPLKAEVTAFQQETQKAEKVAKECERALNLEKETQEAIKKQYEIKLKKTQIEHEFILADLECQKKELLLKHTNLEKVLEDHKIKSSELQISLEQTEAKCLELKRDLQNKTEAVERLESVENEVESLRQELSEVTSKLEVATKTLTKEQGKNKSAAQHNQQVKTKQNMLSERISELNEENENLREQVGALEEESQHLEESLQEARREAQQMQKEKANQEVIIKNLNAEKAELERCIEETEAQIKELEVQVEQAKERERMLIEYPDLNGPVNPDLHGTGDIATDMENQVKANIMRIQVLEDLNERLRRSITKVLSAGLGTSASSNSVPKPVPLLEPHHLHSLNQQNDTSAPVAPLQVHCANSQNVMPLQMQASSVTSESSQKSTSSKFSEYFVVGKMAAETGKNKKPAHKSSAQRSSNGMISTSFAPVNSTSIGTYKKIKKSVGQSRPDIPSGKGKSLQSGHSSHGISVPHGEDYASLQCYICDNCDKMYTNTRDLTIHKLYCTR